MFTGLIEEMGTITDLQSKAESSNIKIKCAKVMDGLQIGDSIAVNGVCLTATASDADNFTVIATPETLARTNLDTLQMNDHVNLERPLTLQSRLGGHMVQGHIDGTGEVAAITTEGDSQRWEFIVSPDIAKYLILKGSVAINGVSLTIASIQQTSFTVALIPKTIETTTFQHIKPGDTVNIETDMIGKYVHSFLEQRDLPF